MRSAAVKMMEVFRIIQKNRLERGIMREQANDPYHSGLIGVEFTPITTTLGNLEAKQTSLNPDFAALLVKWLNKCAADSNQNIAIQASASFPALTFAAIIACETLGLQPRVSVSLGSSSYGANIPQFTYLDMEKILIDSAIIACASQLITPGGTNDNLTSGWPGAENILNNSVQRSGTSLFIPQSLRNAVHTKRKFFERYGTVDVFINIGGNHASLGNSSCALQIPSGLILQDLPCETSGSEQGLILMYNQSAIPVIHLLNIREIAMRNGIRAHPRSVQDIGISDIYYDQQKPTWIYISTLGITMITGIIFVRYQPGRRQGSIPSVLKTISTSRK